MLPAQDTTSPDRPAARPRGRRVASFVGLAVLVVLAGAAALAVRERQIRAEIDSARRDRATGRAGEAARRLRDLAGSWRPRGDVLFELGRSEAAIGRADAAVEAWGRVPPGSPEFSPATARLAEVEITRGRFARAESTLSAALGAGAGADVRDALVRLLRSEGRAGEARRLYLDGVATAPDLVVSLRGLNRLDVEPFAVEGLRIYLAQAARGTPEDDRVRLGLAHLATVTGQFDEADRLLDACTQSRPDDPAVWRARLDWARAADRPDSAVAALPHLPADEATTLDLRAWFAARRGDREAERSALERLLALDPGRSDALARLAELAGPDEAAALRARKAEVDRARDAYRRIVAGPDSASHADELARLAATLGLRFEASGWSRVAGRPGPLSVEPPPTRGATLAESLADLAEVRGKAPPPARSGPGRDVAFVDTAEAAGLSFVQDNGAVAGRLIPPVTMSGGVALLDVDGDGYLDVYAVQGGPFPPSPGSTNADRLFRNRGDGTFEDVTARSGLAAFPGGYGHGVAVGDVDNDGRPDLFVTRWRSYALYRNKGDGTFEDLTDRAGLGGDRDWPTSAAFADLDNDGDLDLYVCHYLIWDADRPVPCVDPARPSAYRCNPGDFPARPDHLFRNDGGRFVDVTDEAGIVDRDGRGLGVVAADLDDDGKVDLYVANDTTANYLFRNLGGLRFEERAAASGAAANAGGGYQAGMGVALGDLDGDGRPDLAVTNFTNESTSLFRNLGGGQFADATAASGLAVPSRFLLGFGLAFLDANDDGRPDLLSVNGHIHDGRPQFAWKMPAQLLMGGPGGRVVDVSRRAGPPFAVNRMGRGLAVGDLDNDGRVDAVVLGQGEPLALFKNVTEAAGHSITIGLEGRGSNRDGVGARLTVRAGGRTQVVRRFGGGSYQSAGDPRLHVGLGAATRVESAEVRWPSGRVDRFADLPADAGHLLREADPLARPLPGFSAKGSRDNP